MNDSTNRALSVDANSPLWGKFVASPLWPATVFATLLVAWEVYVRVSHILPIILLAPSDVAIYMWQQRVQLLENALAHTVRSACSALRWRWLAASLSRCC